MDRGDPGRRDQPRRSDRTEPTRCAHFYRKGYYLDSDAELCCMLCGHEASADEILPAGARPDE